MSSNRLTGHYWARIKNYDGIVDAEWTVIRWSGERASILGNEGSIAEGDVAEWGPVIPEPEVLAPYVRLLESYDRALMEGSGGQPVGLLNAERFPLRLDNEDSSVA